LEIDTEQTTRGQELGYNVNAGIGAGIIILVDDMEQGPIPDDKELVVVHNAIFPVVFVVLKEFHFSFSVGRVSKFQCSRSRVPSGGTSGLANALPCRR
jgi:hypothetical protein